MANEVRVMSQLRINKTGVNAVRYDGVGPNSFTANMSGAKGPSPGAISATIYGTDVNLSQLTNPSWCEVVNQGTQYTVELGVYDPERERFFPLLEVRPGEKTSFRLASNLGGEYGTGPGTGTHDLGAGTNRLRARGIGGTTIVYIGAFDE